MYSTPFCTVARYLLCICTFAFLSVAIGSAQTPEVLAEQPQTITYPRSTGKWFVEFGAAPNSASNINFKLWSYTDYITLQSMNTSGFNIHQGILWNFMPSAENNLIVRLGWNVDFSGYTGQQAATQQQLPSWLQQQLPRSNAELETAQPLINARHDISMTLSQLTLSASYRHRILPVLSLEVGGESSVLLGNRVQIRQSYTIRQGNMFQLDGDVVLCPKPESIPLERIAIPLNFIGGLHIHSSEKISFYIRYHYSLLSFMPEYSWRTDRLTLGMEFNFDS